MLRGEIIIETYKTILYYISCMADSNFQPYYVAIFTSLRSSDSEGYDEMDSATYERVATMPGYMGAESFSSESGRRVTIVKFRSEQDMLFWRRDPLHVRAQDEGRKRWYDHYNIKVCRVEREYEFTRTK